MREGDSLWMFCVGCSWSNGIEKAPPFRKELVLLYLKLCERPKCLCTKFSRAEGIWVFP